MISFRNSIQSASKGNMSFSAATFRKGSCLAKSALKLRLKTNNDKYFLNEEVFGFVDIVVAEECELVYLKLRVKQSTYFDTQNEHFRKEQRIYCRNISLKNYVEDSSVIEMNESVGVINDSNISYSNVLSSDRYSLLTSSNLNQSLLSPNIDKYKEVKLSPGVYTIPFSFEFSNKTLISMEFSDDNILLYNSVVLEISVPGTNIVAGKSLVVMSSEEEVNSVSPFNFKESRVLFKWGLFK